MRQWQLGRGDDAASIARRSAASEVYLRRFYRVRRLSRVVHHEIGDVRFAAADYTDGGVAAGPEPADVHVIVTFQPIDRLGAVASAIAEYAATVAPDRQLVVDLIASRSGEVGDIEALADEVRTRAASADFGRRVHRFDVVVTADEGSAEEHLRTQSVTVCQAEDGSWSEDELYRNLHPMLGERPGAVAPAQLRTRASALPRGRVPVPWHGARQPPRPASVRVGRGS